MIKLIASDMDGTLLNDKDEIHEEFYQVFQELKKQNIIFAAASGRQYYNLAKRFEKIKDDMMFIAENGTFVVYKGEELLLNALDKETAIELIKIGRHIKESYVVLCGKKSAYIESKDERLIKEVEKYYEEYKIVNDLTKVEDDILKVTICDFIGSEENSYTYYNDYKEKLQVSVSGQIWLDITDKGVNKGLAINKLQELLNIKHEETMVFGDYLNDLEMMENAYYSYAMKNGHEKIKEVSNFETDFTNNENGVIETIKKYVLKNEYATID